MFIALTLCLGAVGLSAYVVWHIDSAPRTDDAYLYADTITLAPEVGGKIIEFDVHDNQEVRQGEVLFRIDPRPYEAILVKVRAGLVALDNEIMLAQRTVDAQKFAAQAAGAAVDRARASERQAGDTLARMEPLKGTDYLADEQIDQARTAKATALAVLEGARLDERRAQATISGVEALVAKKAVLQAEIQLAELNLSYATVVAPINGIVLNLKTTTGQFVAAGHPVFTLIDTRHWYTIANFRETELRDISVGQHVTVYVMGYPRETFDGTVDSIGYGVFPDDGGAEIGGLSRVPRSINWVRVAQRFPVKIRIAHPDPSLFRIGASAVAVLRDRSADEQH
jgi:multidrug efflux system membrane fusion protein